MKALSFGKAGGEPVLGNINDEAYVREDTKLQKEILSQPKYHDDAVPEGQQVLNDSYL